MALKEAFRVSYNPSPGPIQTAGPQLHWAPKSMESRARRGWKALLFTRTWGEGCEGGADLAAVALRDLTGASVPVAMGGWVPRTSPPKHPPLLIPGNNGPVAMAMRLINEFIWQNKASGPFK